MPESKPDVLGRLDEWLMRREQSFGKWVRKRGSGRTSCYRAYTLLFIPFALLVLSALLLARRELMWYIDGLNQYYPFFIREGQVIREIVGDLFSGQGLNVPMWEWNSGYGADVLVTFDVYLDPLNLVSAITPPALSEWVFQLLVVLRFYLSGLAFVFYCQVRSENRAGTVLGALLYALCGAALTAVKWASGIHALMLFPVVLAGAELILKGKRPWVFIASFALLSFVSYYFTYMTCILLVGYLTVRVCMVERPHLTVGRFLRWVGVFAGLVALSFLLAGIVLVPSMLAVLGMGRVTDAKAAVPIVYSLDYYLRMAGDFLSIHEVGSDTYQGFGGVAFLACVALFLRKDEKALRRILVVLFVLMCVPLFGSLMNGMNYATNRWAWAYALCMALVLTRVTPDLLALQPHVKGVLVVGTCAYALLLLVPAFRSVANVAGFGALALALLLLVATTDFRARRSVLVGTLALTMTVNGCCMLSEDAGGVGSGQSPFGVSYPTHTAWSVNSLACETNDTSWWRYDAGQVELHSGPPIARVRNNSLVLGLRGIDFYNSIYDDHVDQFHTELGVAGDDVNFSYTNLQGRSDLLNLVGAKYYLFRGDGTDALPYGYSQQNTVVERAVWDIPYSLVRSDTAFSVGTGFSRAISAEEYESLTPIERQQALLQAVVLDDEVAQGTARTSARDLSYENANVPFEITSSNAVVCDTGKFVVSQGGGSVTLTFQGTPNAETLVSFQGLAYRGMKPSESVSEEERAAMPWYRRAKLLAEDLTYAEPVQYELTLSSDASSKLGYITNYTPRFHMFGGKDTWLVDLGYAEDAARTITISFDSPGIYTYDDLQVQTMTHNAHASWLTERNSARLEQVEQSCNTLSGTIELGDSQTLLLTVPYSTGWSAYVDGVPTSIMRADTAFMAIELEPGTHTVELRYATPGLAQGALVTVAGLVGLVALVIVLRWRDRHIANAA